jgi:formylglycine-generating enzyme
LLSLALLFIGQLALKADPRSAVDAACPEEMALVGATCVDRYEASLSVIDDAGKVLGEHPANKPVGKARVRAKSQRGALPQAYISQNEAAAACKNAGKRLCTSAEWQQACGGEPKTRYPYGQARQRGACNDEGREPLASIAKDKLSPDTWGIDPMNDPRLHLVPGGVAHTGRFDRCRSEAGIHDMVGNVHEWTSDESGTMRGGYYLDTATLGLGCGYAATAHGRDYHDYSTGFRCCQDAVVTNK